MAQTTVLIGVNPCLTERNMKKQRSKKTKMSVNPAVFLEKQGDIREKRRKFELNLKKQSQFIKRQNERKLNYNKEIREIYWVFA